MIVLIGMELLPLGFGLLYLCHSVRRKRRGQAIAIGVLLLVMLAALAVLLWEFYSMPK